MAALGRMPTRLTSRPILPTLNGFKISGVADGRTLVRGVGGWQGLRAPDHPHRHRDGQYAVLDPDHEPAAAPYRSSFRCQERMGSAAHEQSLHPRLEHWHFRE